MKDIDKLKLINYLHDWKKLAEVQNRIFLEFLELIDAQPEDMRKLEEEKDW